MKACIILFSIISAVAFLSYAADKRRAVLGKRRIPEKCLLALSFFGGAVGGYLAMFACRHKTRKGYFHLVNILGVAWQLALVFALALRGV